MYLFQISMNMNLLIKECEIRDIFLCWHANAKVFVKFKIFLKLMDKLAEEGGAEKCST